MASMFSMLSTLRAGLFGLLSFMLIYMASVCTGTQYTETQTQVCYTDVFRARCPYTQQILITQAKYGHIEVSKCVSEMFASLGQFGCFADVQEIVSRKCGGKQRCEITMPDTEIIATKTCPTGLPMYLDVTYVCIPETIQGPNCRNIEVSKRLQYILSTEIQRQTCVNGQDGISKQATFKASNNMKVKFTFGLITHSAFFENSSEPFGYLVAEQLGTEAVMITGEHTEATSKIHEVSLVLTPDTTAVVIIGFQEVGCSDLVAPPFTWVKRKKDLTTVGCHNNDFTWQLRCEASNWIGFTGNCTDKVKVLVNPEPARKNIEATSTEKYKEPISKEILFALIIGVTVFLCAVVITAGFVCLKFAKYKASGKKNNSMEMNTIPFDGEVTTSWTRGKSMNGQPTVNNQWQQTIKSQGVPGNQKYYILDREDINTLRT